MVQVYHVFFSTAEGERVPYVIIKIGKVKIGFGVDHFQGEI